MLHFCRPALLSMTLLWWPFLAILPILFVDCITSRLIRVLATKNVFPICSPKQKMNLWNMLGWIDITHSVLWVIHHLRWSDVRQWLFNNQSLFNQDSTRCTSNTSFPMSSVMHAQRQQPSFISHRALLCKGYEIMRQMPPKLRSDFIHIVAW